MNVFVVISIKGVVVGVVGLVLKDVEVVDDAVVGVVELLVVEAVEALVDVVLVKGVVLDGVEVFVVL